MDKWTNRQNWSSISRQKTQLVFTEYLLFYSMLLFYRNFIIPIRQAAQITSYEANVI